MTHKHTVSAIFFVYINRYSPCGGLDISFMHHQLAVSGFKLLQSCISNSLSLLK